MARGQGPRSPLGKTEVRCERSAVPTSPSWAGARARAWCCTGMTRSGAGKGGGASGVGVGGAGEAPTSSMLLNMDIRKGGRLVPADRDKLGAALERDYVKGRSLVELAEQHGTSAGRVRTILLERGVALRSRGGSVRKPDPERERRAKEVAKKYRAGATLAELGSEYGVSASTARNLVQAGGGQLRPRGGGRSGA